MSEIEELAGPLENPRKKFDESVDYAVQIATTYLALFKDKAISLDGLNFLEIGPGADFAPHLVFASHGARMTLVDPYLADWDPAYHPAFYEAFLKKWQGPNEAVVAALRQNSYDGLLTLVREPAEHMRSVPSAAFDFVQSNAALEHVLDISKAVKELARVTRPGGIHSHQVDFRDHRNYDRPLDHLTQPEAEYLQARQETNCIYGTSQRMPEMIEVFAKYFWIWRIQTSALASADHVESVRQRLPSGSRYSTWPAQLLRETSGCLWLVRKDTKPSLWDRLVPWR